jgi:RHS repeat-associated protein
MVARSVTPNNSYRYGYQQAEHYDDLVGGDYDFGARIFDPRIARWLTVDPTKLQNSDWTPYQFGKDCPIVYIDHDGAKEYIYLTSINEQTGKTTVYKMTARALLMTDGIQHHIQDTRETYHYENYYYDFVTHITVTKKKDGSISVQQTTTILKTAAPKDVEYVWFGGDKRGDLKYDNSIEGARGESPCEWCGDNSGSVQQGGVVFSGSNDAGSAAEMYRDAIGKNITVVEGDISRIISRKG